MDIYSPDLNLRSHLSATLKQKAQNTQSPALPSGQHILIWSKQTQGCSTLKCVKAVNATIVVDWVTKVSLFKSDSQNLLNVENKLTAIGVLILGQKAFATQLEFILRAII